MEKKKHFVEGALKVALMEIYKDITDVRYNSTKYAETVEIYYSDGDILQINVFSCSLICIMRDVAERLM